MKLFQLYPKALAHLACKSPLIPILSGEKEMVRNDGLEVWKLGGLEVWTGLTLRGIHRAGPKGQTFHG